MKIMAYIHKYNIVQLTMGEILFKLLIQKLVIDTRETSMVMSNNLSLLGTYISNVKSDMSKFNQYMKLNITKLQSHG